MSGILCEYIGQIFPKRKVLKGVVFCKDGIAAQLEIRVPECGFASVHQNLVCMKMWMQTGEQVQEGGLSGAVQPD